MVRQPLSTFCFALLVASSTTSSFAAAAPAKEHQRPSRQSTTFSNNGFYHKLRNALFGGPTTTTATNHIISTTTATTTTIEFKVPEEDSSHLFTSLRSWSGIRTTTSFNDCFFGSFSQLLERLESSWRRATTVTAVITTTAAATVSTIQYAMAQLVPDLCARPTRRVPVPGHCW
jgi:hypothetical protein